MLNGAYIKKQYIYIFSHLDHLTNILIKKYCEQKIFVFNVQYISEEGNNKILITCITALKKQVFPKFLKP